MCRGLLTLDWDAWPFVLVLWYLDTRLVGLVLTPTWWTRRRVLFELRVFCVGFANGRIRACYSCRAGFGESALWFYACVVIGWLFLV